MVFRVLFLFATSFFVALVTAASAQAQVQELINAERLLLQGNYQEGLDAFAALSEQYPVPAALGRVRCLVAQGEQAAAKEILDEALQVHAQEVDLLAEQAALAIAEGDLTTATKRLTETLQLQPEHILSRWLQAELYRLQGNIKEACTAYRWCAEHYDQRGKQIKNPRDLIWIGQAIAQHARFNRDHRRFHQLTGQLYPQVLRLEPHQWQAHYHSALLLIEKFNTADAQTALNDALEINPHTADIHAAKGHIACTSFDIDKAERHVDRALRMNPNHLAAIHCRADVAFSTLQPARALAILEKANVLNPISSGTLGRLAAAHALLASPNLPQHQQKLHQLIREMEQHTTNLAEFHATWGMTMERARRYPLAGAQFRQAIEQLPELVGPRGQLGMIEMRLGHEEEARRWLEESFAIDPYNVRVKNQLEVLSLLEDYETLETEHFIIRFDPQHDQRLGNYLAEHIEQWHDQLSQEFQFELPEQSVIEIFHDGRGQSAREWFGARMVGLPNIHTIAACSGNVVAMVSPASEKIRINWADVMRHEMVHLLNIRQTKYAVPNWLTEGCAVWQEGRRRSLRWEKMLLKRFPQGRVFDLNSINLGFLRPRSQEDWQLAYCQAEVYVDVIIREFGHAGLEKLLLGFRDNLPPEEIFQEALGVSQSALDELVTNELEEIVNGLSDRSDLRNKSNLSQATELYEADSGNPELAAKLALARLEHGDYPGAGKLAEEVLRKSPQQALAQLVKAKLLLRIGNEQQATQLLETLVAAEPPNLDALSILGKIHLTGGDFAEAKYHYQQGAKLEPENVQWIKALAVVALREKNEEELGSWLARVAEADPGNLLARKKCLELAKRRTDVKAVRRWSREVLHVDPRDEEAYETYQSLKED